MKNTKSSKIEMMLELDKFETCQKGSGLLEDGISRDVYQPSEQHGDKKKKGKIITLYGVKILTD